MTSLPEDFLKSLSSLPGVDVQAFLDAHQQPAPVSIRLHPVKWKKWAPGLKPDTLLPIDSPVPWSANGYYLRERPSFLFDPLFYAGAYYVQEASSMFVDFVMKQWSAQRRSTAALLLDLCAAPGGKSTILLDHLQPDDLLVNNETVPQRGQILQENLIRWGYPQIVLTQAEAHYFQSLPMGFDLILVDAPCSGSGMFRKDRQMCRLWTPGSVTACSKKQQHLVTDIWPALKPGGWLIYSTCSFSMEEDEQVVDALIAQTQAEPLHLQIPDSWGIVHTFTPQHRAPVYRFYPDRLAGEGFFLAVLRKSDHQTIQPRSAFLKKHRIFEFGQLKNEWPEAYLPKNADVSVIQYEEKTYLFPTAQIPALHELARRVPIRMAGLCVGKFNKEWIPDHALSLQIGLREDLPTLELNREQALRYLQKHSPDAHPLTPGWYLVTYHRFPLGWIKSIGHRINNCYPAAWKMNRTIPEHFFQ
ncbi:methyltransferase RsmF C-terminal domain-like protein [Thermoflavifilum thermophilum]|uniref:16S rRNA C967 or C1407 C5-methylase, RsmB/RsmF family n=1 Tax=Thermoflavifilum thermophilum TaxID=1393122 RepID=A0A1I7NJU6_9BACT|nr:hypothetical protein [Thermoflavifilum thermophilum]SFV34879.1 16S rRNA C967 or C1407 C5-methylase, RsmB/RsmF family [Thermoflavifilum thermophilum]